MSDKKYTAYASRLVSQIQEIRTTLLSFKNTSVPDSVMVVVGRKIEQIANAVEKIRNMFSSEYNAIAKMSGKPPLGQEVPRISDMDGILAKIIPGSNSKNVVNTSQRKTKNNVNAILKRLDNLNSKVGKNKLQ